MMEGERGEETRDGTRLETKEVEDAMGRSRKTLNSLNPRGKRENTASQPASQPRAHLHHRGAPSWTLAMRLKAAA